MKRIVLLAAVSVAVISGQLSHASDRAMSADEVGRFAQLAMDCIPQEYPNKLNQVLTDATSLRSPKDLHPAFYGCYDWHSSVHGHWMLVKALREYDNLPHRDVVLSQLLDSMSEDKIATELAYFEDESKSWERMYGWAWLLQLQNELASWDDPDAQRMSRALQPLSDYLRDRYMSFLPVQVYPVRTGVHPNTAFGMSFAYDYAQAVGDREFAALLEQAAMRYYGTDTHCPIAWEPSGEDFLSPCLEEAALMSRVLDDNAFEDWLAAFLPGLGRGNGLAPVDVSDRTDPKIVHLDGLNLSRAWNLLIIANTLSDATLAASLRQSADQHLAASLPFVTADHYVGSHWLGSFAIYALTRDRYSTTRRIDDGVAHAAE
ncbi:MAG: DUF2891 domain-containing protein [Pseudomonadota bacterium]